MRIPESPPFWDSCTQSKSPCFTMWGVPAHHLIRTGSPTRSPRIHRFPRPTLIHFDRRPLNLTALDSEGHVPFSRSNRELRALRLCPE